MDRLVVRIFISSSEVHPNLRKHEWPHVYIGCHPFELENYQCVDKNKNVWVHSLWYAAGGSLPQYQNGPPLRWFISRDIKKRSYCVAEPNVWFWDNEMDIVDIRGVSTSNYLMRVIRKECLQNMVQRYGYILYDPTIRLCESSVSARVFLQEHWSRIRKLRELAWLKDSLGKQPDSLQFIHLLKQVQHGLIVSRQDNTLTWKGRLLRKMYR